MSDPETEVIEAPSAPEDTSAPIRSKARISPALKVGLVMAALSSAVAALLLRSPAGDSLSYSKLVHEVVDDPSAFGDRQLRVEGTLKQGSIRFREEPCEWRFIIASRGRELPVEFPECIVPDTLKDSFGIQVTVQGHLQPNGSFLANEVIPRCPSKYEMQQQLENGATMPHPPAEAAATPTTPTTPAAPVAPQPPASAPPG